MIDHDPRQLERLDWDKTGGLLPAIVQHAVSGAVLMLGYMDREALAATLARGRAVFYSRSRQRLWEKGETSGHSLDVQAVRVDCDADTLLIAALPRGPACHTGTATCFGDIPVAAAERLSFLATLQQIIGQRIAEAAAPASASPSAPASASGAAAPSPSYTARLYASGLRRMAQKVGEEGVEVALAAVGGSDAELIGESADLLFHLLVLLRARSMDLERVLAELQRRHAERAAERAGP